MSGLLQQCGHGCPYSAEAVGVNPRLHMGIGGGV